LAAMVVPSFRLNRFDDDSDAWDIRLCTLFKDFFNMCQAALILGCVLSNMFLQGVSVIRN
jgi:hypothetical protein